MSFWTKMRCTMGGSDPRHWRVPGFLAMRLRSDHGRRALFALGIGLGVSGPLAAIMLAIAPPDQIGWAVCLSLLMVAAVGAVAFLYNDAGETIISLEDDGLRRRIKPFFVNLFGWRNRNEFWAYDSMGPCGVVPADRAGGKYAVLAIAVPEQTLAVIVPRNVDIKQVTAFLVSQQVKLKAIPQLPPEAWPQPSVGRRGMVVAGVVAVAGVLLSLTGSAARLAIYREEAEVDSAAVAAAVKDAPEGDTVREYQGIGRGGVNQARISPDGKWVWALTKGKRHQRV